MWSTELYWYRPFSKMNYPPGLVQCLAAATRCYRHMPTNIRIVRFLRANSLLDEMLPFPLPVERMKKTKSEKSKSLTILILTAAQIHTFPMTVGQNMMWIVRHSLPCNSNEFVSVGEAI